MGKGGQGTPGAPGSEGEVLLHCLLLCEPPGKDLWVWGPGVGGQQQQWRWWWRRWRWRWRRWWWAQVLPPLQCGLCAAPLCGECGAFPCRLLPLPAALAQPAPAPAVALAGVPLPSLWGTGDPGKGHHSPVCTPGGNAPHPSHPPLPWGKGGRGAGHRTPHPPRLPHPTPTHTHRGGVLPSDPGCHREGVGGGGPRETGVEGGWAHCHQQHHHQQQQGWWGWERGEGQGTLCPASAFDWGACGEDTSRGAGHGGGV